MMIRKSDLVLINNKKRTCQFAICWYSKIYKVKMKGSNKIDKYLDRELKKSFGITITHMFQSWNGHQRLGKKDWEVLEIRRTGIVKIS